MIKEYEVVKKNMSALLNIVNEYDFEWDDSKGMYENLNNFFNKQLNLSKKKTEHLYVVALDLKNRVIGIQHNACGNDRTVEQNKQSMSLFLNLINADGFILLHNHPKVDGYTKDEVLGFSDDDIIFNEDYLKYRKCNGISCMDSMVISYDDYVVYTHRFGS